MILRLRPCAAGEDITVGNLLKRVESLQATLVGGPKEFRSSLDVITSAVVPVGMDFTSGEFASFAGDLLKATGSLSFDFAISLGLEFTFGVNNDGDFYVRNPSLKVHLSVNDDPLVAVNPDQNILSVAGDRAVSYLNGRTLSLGGGDSTGVNFTVVGNAVFDAAKNQTDIKVAESVADVALTQRIRPTFDLGLSMYDIIGAQIDDGVMDLNVEFNLDSRGEMVLDSDTSRFTGSLVDETGNALRYRPTFGDGTRWDIRLPVSLTAPLAGIDPQPIVFTAQFDNSNSGAKLNGADGLVGMLGAFVTSPAALVSIIRADEAGTLDETFADTLLNSGLHADRSFGSLVSFQGLSLEQILAAFNLALDKLVGDATDNPATSGVDEQGLAFKPLAPFNKSVVELLGNGSGDLITSIRSAVRSATAAATDLQSLDREANIRLKQALGMAQNAPDIVHLSYANSTFVLGIQFETSVDLAVPLDVNLGDFSQELADVSDVLGLSIAGDRGVLAVHAGARFELGVGFDLTNVLDPAAYVEDRSGISFQVEAIVTEPLTGTAGIDVPLVGQLSLAAIDGDAGLNLNMRLGLNDDSAGSGTSANGGKKGDNRYLLSEVVSALDTAVAGAALLDLPLYFPTTVLPLGGTTEDMNSDGVADNVLRLTATFDVNGIHTDYIAPELASQFSLMGLINNPTLVITSVKTGLNGLFDTIDKGLESGVFNVPIPLVGEQLKEKLGFAGGTSFVDTLRFDINGKLNDALAAIGGRTTVELIQQALFDAFGPGSDGKGPAILVDQNNRPISRVQDVPVVATTDYIQFNVRLADKLITTGIPLDIAAALPGLDLDIDGNIQVDLGYQFEFGFGFHKTDGFYFDTTGALPSGEEFAFTLSATLADTFKASGTLGYLTVDVSEVVDDRNSGLYGSFGVDIRDPNGDGRFTIGEIGRAALRDTIVGTFQAEADVDLAVAVAIPKSASVNLQFPELTTTLHYDQVFANVSTAPGAASEFGGAPIVEFQNVRLDLGEFITGFVGPIIDEVHKVTGPVEPVVDVLRQDIGLLVQLKAERTNLLQIAEGVLGPTKYEPVLTAINAIIDIVDFVEKVDALRRVNPDGNLILEYGSFIVGGNLKSQGGSQVPASAPTSSDPNRQLAGGSNAGAKGNAQATEVVKSIGTKPGSIQFPLLSDPSVAFGLLLGKPETLFIYDMPKLDLAFTYIKSFPIFYGLNARLGGRVTASTDFAFAFDTSGFQQWKSGGFSPGDVGVLFDGFSVSDHGTENTASDRPEVTLTASIIAGPSIGIAGLVEAGVEGDITAKIDFDLNDVPTPGSNPLEYDGQLTLDELSQRASQGLACVFDTSGQLSAGLTGFLWVGVDTGLFGRITLYENRISLYRETLATFELGCKDLVPPTLGTVNGGVLTLAYQPSADFPVLPNGDTYQVSQFTDDSVTKIRVQANGFTQNFSGIADRIQRYRRGRQRRCQQRVGSRQAEGKCRKRHATSDCPDWQHGNSRVVRRRRRRRADRQRWRRHAAWRCRQRRVVRR